MHATPAITLSGISLDRGGRTVLHAIEARVAAGSVTAIVGPSGAGKTSLLRCINRLEEVEGKIELFGRDIRSIDPSELRRRVGMIFQTPVLFEGGVRANLEYGMNRNEDEALLRVLDRVGLDAAFLERSSTALSVGQAQRICIGRALLRDPQVLLMDEPTSALDGRARDRVERTIQDLAAGGLTVILVTHDLAQAQRLASAALLLVDGRVVAQGSPLDMEAIWSEGSFS